MKDILKDTLVIILSALVSSIGLVALSVAFQSEPYTYIFILSLFISWIILYPTYKYWTEFFKSLFKFNDDKKN